jgi:hypothetical protein
MDTEVVRVKEEVQRAGPPAAFQRLIAQNNDWIRRPDLDHGRQIASARTAVYTELVRAWAEGQQRARGYDKPFAVVALGGTGRAELAPCSDLDFALLFDDAIEGNAFLLELQRQTLHSEEFKRSHEFTFRALPFSLDDVPMLVGKQLNAFLDMRPVYDPSGLAEVFRERIRSTFDPFEHFLHVRGFWKDQWERAADETERLDRFDIKNDGLRLFLAGIWTLAGKHFVHSHDIYQSLDDPRDLEAYDLLLRIRSFVHLHHTEPMRSLHDGSHSEDVLSFDDFYAFGDWLGPDADERARFEFANHVRARLLAARRRVARFARSVIGRELKRGREVSPGNPIVYGVDGLYHAASSGCRLPRDKSRAALSLLLASQRYGVPVDASELEGTFRDAGDWLVRTPELSALFYEQRGSLAESFAFLSQIEGAQDRLFPGYAKFEASLDARVMAERKSLRGALERRKINLLEHSLRQGRDQLAGAISASRLAYSNPRVSAGIEAALLDPDHLAAVKLALKTKRLPLTADDLAMRADDTLPLHERFSSGFSEISFSDYYQPYAAESDFPQDTLRLVEFLVAHRRAFKERAESGLNDTTQVEEFVRLCGSEDRLRALFVFTCADRAEWESEEIDPARWFNTRELYAKALMRFRPAADSSRVVKAAGYSPEQLAILKDFGDDFFAGNYRQYANRFGVHLLRLAEEPDTSGPRAGILREGASLIVGVAARDYRGLAATISGALWHHGINLRQAHLFSAMHHGLALDFFHLAPREGPLPSDLARFVEEAIQQRLFIADGDESKLPRICGTGSIREWRQGLFCLRFETTEEAGGLVYALTYKIYRHLRGHLFALTAHAVRGRAFVSVYHTLPDDLTLEQAQTIVTREF